MATTAPQRPDADVVDADVVDADVVDADVVDDVVQPAEAEPAAKEPTSEEQAPVETGQDVVKVATSLDLTFRDTQTELTSRQHAALRSVLNFEPKESPQAVAAVQAFLHLSISRRLDPFAREVYLIARGKGDKRKFTMQVGIDGYRKMAGDTGNFIGVESVVWTGKDDDDKSWRYDERTSTMRRVWYDQWPSAKGEPGAAKVVVLHYDSRNNVVRTEAIADWEMYAPYEDKWTGPSGNRSKVIGPDGQPVRTLNDMWTKGGPHMIAKCAEALAYRRALPGALSGMYIHEEMHRADQIETDRVKSEAHARIIAAQAEKVAKAVPEPAAEPEQPAAEQEPGEAPAGPPTGVPDAPVEAEPVSVEPDEAPAGTEPVAPQDEGPTPEQALAWLREEIGYQSAVLDKPVTDLVRRQMSAAGVENAGDLTAEDLAEVVFPNRGVVLAALRRQNRDAEGEVYGSWGPEQIGPVAVLTGQSQS